MLALIILRNARATEATSAEELQIQSDSGRTLLRGFCLFKRQRIRR